MICRAWQLFRCGERGKILSLPLSLVVIVLNEERNLRRCLESVQGLVSEVIVVDSGSQDGTRRIAEDFGAKWIEHPWSGFGPQKNFAVAQASHDWVLCLDADEALSPELRDLIRSSFSSLQPDVGYRFARRSWFFGRWIFHGGWYPDYQLRMFHRRFHQWDLAPIHERVRAEKIQTLPADLLHYVFADVAENTATNNRYSGLQAQAFVAGGGQFSLFRMLVKPVSKFLECYLWKRGFLDGLAGWVIAVGAAHSVFMRWAKIAEIESGFAGQPKTPSTVPPQGGQAQNRGLSPNNRPAPNKPTGGDD